MVLVATEMLVDASFSVWNSPSSINSSSISNTTDEVFTATAAPNSTQSSAGITVNFTTSGAAGYMTSLGYDGVSKYANNTDAWYTLLVPRGSVVMISFSHLDIEAGNTKDSCGWDFFRISFGDHFPEVYCAQIAVPAKIYESSSLTFYFHSDLSYANLGFKLRFSFHAKRQRPRKLRSGLFVCNTSLYESFRLHLDCNLIVECQNGEDEWRCPGTTEMCRGAFQYGSKCYRYFSSKTISWNKAAAECTNRGARLAMTRTFSEAAAVRDMILKGKRASKLFVGLHVPQQKSRHYNSQLWQWIDGSISYSVRPEMGERNEGGCTSMLPDSLRFESLSCEESYTGDFICEFIAVKNEPSAKVSLTTMNFLRTSYSAGGECLPLVSCPDGHVTRDFLACDAGSACGYSGTESHCSSRVLTVPKYSCSRSAQFIPYTLVCDFHSDCEDGSDETFCYHEDCSTGVACENGQCLVTLGQKGDHKHDCRDESDERQVKMKSADYFDATQSTDAISLGSDGLLKRFDLDPSGKCPETHVKCADSHCLPVFVVCNMVYDCPGWEDEEMCDSYTCPGFYRCRHSSVCLHLQHLCDGVPRCPLQDDELLCAVRCPWGCQCRGLSAVCPRSFLPGMNPQLRYIDASGSLVTVDLFNASVYLVGLRLARCELSQVQFNGTLRNLQQLDLRENLITIFRSDWLSGFGNLRELKLERNPLTVIADDTGAFSYPSNLRVADFSKTRLKEISVTFSTYFRNTRILNLSDTDIQSLPAAFPRNFSLQVLDLRRTSIKEYPGGFLRSLANLQQVYGDRYTLCCRANVPDQFTDNNCQTEQDVVSSCDSLISSEFYRVFAWVVSVAALFVNVVNVIHLVYCRRSFSVFQRISVSQALLINLSVSNICSSVYLLVIVVADVIYRGEYWRHDLSWPSSITCNVAGALSGMSDHASGIVVLLLVLERVRRAYNPGIRGGGEASKREPTVAAACILTWTLAPMVTAMVLLLPGVADDSGDRRLLANTGLCAPVVILLPPHPLRPSLFSAHFVLRLVQHVLTVGLVVYVKLTTRRVMKSDDVDYLQWEDVVWTGRVCAIVTSEVACTLGLVLHACLASLIASDVYTSLSDDVSVGLHLLVRPLKTALTPLLSLYFTAKEARDRQGMLTFLHSN